jgi:hypothetical protein
VRKIVFIISVVIFGFLVTPFEAQAALIHDMGHSHNYNIRIDGPDATSNIGDGSIVSDIDNDGKQDLIIASSTADNNSRTNSGSVYLIYGTLLDDYNETGNTIDLATSTNWNIRIDGPVATTGPIGVRGSIYASDLDNDGKKELLVGARDADNNSRTNSGSLWIIPGTIIDDYSGTGNTIDLSDTSKYWIRYDGHTNDALLSDGAITTTDLDQDGKQDLLLGARGTNGNRFYVFYNTLIDDTVGTGNNIDLNTSTNYNIVYTGPTIGQLSKDALKTSDIDSDGKQDILVASQNTTMNSRSTSGAVYVIYNTLIDDYIGTGNSVDLTVSSNFNLRYEGSEATEGIGVMVDTADLNNDGRKDIYFGTFGDKNSRTNSGSLYVIYSTLIDDYSSIGNTIDLATNSNFNLRFDGALASDFLVSGPVFKNNVGDYDFDGKLDLLLSTSGTTFNGRTSAGAIYIVFNTRLDDFGNTTGNILDIANDNNFNVEYGGAAASDLLSNFGGQGFVDVNSDGMVDLVISASGTDYNGRSGSGSIYLIYGARREDPTSNATVNHGPDILANTFGIVSKDKITSIMNANTLPWDSVLSVEVTPQKVFRIPSSFYWQTSPVYEIWHRAHSNNARILSQEVKKPFTIALNYLPSEVSNNLKEKNLRLAYSPNGKKWKIVNSVLDIKNKTVATITKSGGYYMLVSFY